MGYAGDVLGLDIAMGFALALAALSAIMSSVLPFGSARDVYIMIIACRFLMVMIDQNRPSTSRYTNKKTDRQTNKSSTMLVFDTDRHIFFALLLFYLFL